MTKVDKQIRVTLKSDLCVGNGEGFSGVIDTDVCRDKGGIPYIPARRLKGAMLDAAKYINQPSSIVSAIFGLSGARDGGSLQLRSAKLGLIGDPSKANQILSLFASVKAQTAIENDSAKTNTLRFTRTISHYSPIRTDEEQVFFADCEIDFKYVAVLENICLATRNIGLNRTRGLGAVRLELVDPPTNEAKPQDESLAQLAVNTYQDGSEYRLPYTITLTDPLMLPSMENEVTEKQISGMAIKGALASLYLRESVGGASSEEFEGLFLKENVIFSNAYIKGAVPAAQFLMEDKKSKRIEAFPDQDDEEMIGEKTEEKDKKPTWKALRGKYVHVDVQASRVERVDAETEIAYHHRRDKNAILYTQERLCAEQVFSGEIIGDGKYLKIIEPLLSEGLCLGRSKTAEYSFCATEIGAAILKDATPIDANKRYILTLESDFLVSNKFGDFIADDTNFISWLETNYDGLHVDLDNDKENSKENGAKRKRLRMLLPVRVGGYYGVWNMKRPHVYGLKAGSYLTFVSNKKLIMPRYIGERNSDGFGRVSICELKAVKNWASASDEVDNSEHTGSGASATADLETAAMEISAPEDARNGKNPGSKVSSEINELLEKQDTLERARMNAIQYAADNKKLLDTLGAAFVGRVSLMVWQAKSFSDLEARVKSIKSNEKRQVTQKIIESQKDTTNWCEALTVIFTLAKYQIKEKQKGHNEPDVETGGESFV